MAVEVVLDFDVSTQSLPALNSAAYRLIGSGTCHIEKNGNRFVCRLVAANGGDADALRSRYLDLVTDENVRANLREKTDPVRNLILSLAFGALASESQDKT
jgi:His-Xaa-Ser system protein HxsD